MIVRDLTQKKTEYKGQPTFASDIHCPCRPCFNAHDCGKFNGGKWHKDFCCATNYNGGCPDPIPEPSHILNRQKRCERCGQYIKDK